MDLFHLEVILNNHLAVSEKELYLKITKGVYTLPDHLSPESKELIKKILELNSINRPAADIVN